MDKAFTDPKYKEAREIVKSGKHIKLYVEDLVDYAAEFLYNKYTETMRKPPMEQYIETFDELKLYCKYINRLGMTITKIEVVE